MPSSVASRRKSSSNKATKQVLKSLSLTPAKPVEGRFSSTPRAADSTATSTSAKAQQQMRPSQTRTVAKQPLENNSNSKPDVFQFLQQGDSSSSTPSATDSENEDEDDDDDDEDEEEEDVEKQHEKPTTNNANSRLLQHRYNSGDDLPSPGSSFRASSPEQTFSVGSRGSISTEPEPTTPPSDGSPASAYLRLAQKHITQSRAQRRRVSSQEQQSDYSAPEEYYIPSHTRAHRASSSSSTHDGGTGTLVTTNRSKPAAKKSSNSSRPAVSGYASLAAILDSSSSDNKNTDNTSSQKLTPVYRRFEKVNHRILLYLQDEISEMEEELQRMDEYDATQRTAIANEDGVRPEPASRRMDVEAARHFSGFHARRTDLLERLMYKTNQYNDALYNYNKLRHALPQASRREIHAYRTWMHENAPISKNETRFLDHEHDLVSVNVAARMNGDNKNILCFIIGVLLTMVLLPYLAY